MREVSLVATSNLEVDFDAVILLILLCCGVPASVALSGEGFLLVFSLAERASFEEIYKFHKQVKLFVSFP